ncbi:MAG: hypothetical protein HY062_11565 [Bacteroidetes bacterium]|nr:hypothetical protein [Bacteroidota bacterium]
MHNNADIDEQLQKLEAICNEASNRYNFYWNKIEMLKEYDMAIDQEMTRNLNKAITDLKDAIFHLHTLQRYCYKHHIDLTKHWTRLGFTAQQIHEFSKKTKK